LNNKTSEALRLEVELSELLLQSPLVLRNLLPGVDVPSMAFIYELICTLMGVKFLPHGVHFAVQGVKHEKLLHEGAQPNIHRPYPMCIDRENYTQAAYNRSMSTAPIKRRSLVIYIDRPEWLNYFKCSRAGAGLVLRRIECVRLLLMPARHVYAEGSLLPSDLMPYVYDPIKFAMPRFVGGDQTLWDDYLILPHRSRLSQSCEESVWVDPSHPSWCSAARGVFWLSIVD
jgi:hypothetical protein